MQQIVVVVAGITLAGLIGCTRAAELRDQFQMSDYRLPFNERLRVEAAAPVIVLGRVLDVKEIGQPQRSNGDPRIKTQLTRINIDVEEVIKGALPDVPVQFFYFTYSAENDGDLGVPRRYCPHAGQRRIYFLKPWEDTYRSVGDVTDYTLPVSSGMHVKGLCQGKGPGCCIAELLLVPGKDLDSYWFVADLIQAEYAAETLCSQRVARDLMQKLTQNPDQRISDRAREVLAGTLPR